MRSNRFVSDVRGVRGVRAVRAAIYLVSIKNKVFDNSLEILKRSERKKRKERTKQKYLWGWGCLRITFTKCQQCQATKAMFRKTFQHFGRSSCVFFLMQVMLMM